MAAARGCWGCGRVWDPAGCNRGHLLWRRCLMLCRFSFALRLGCADARSSLAFAHPSSIFRVAYDAQGGRGGWSAGLARAVAPLLSPRSLRRRSAQPGLFVVVYTCARASFCGLAVCGIVHLVAVVRNAAPRCLVCAGRALSRARRELAARWALPSWVGCMRSVACVCVRSALAGARIFGGVDRAVPRAAAPG